MEINKITRDTLIKQATVFNSEERFYLAKEFVSHKVRNQYHLLVRASERLDLKTRQSLRLTDLSSVVQKIDKVITRIDLLLIEAQVAKLYWRRYFASLGREYKIFYRNQKSPVTRMLNIGYHNLAGILEKSLQGTGLDCGIGFLHQYRRQSRPLVYDLMELFRQPLVDLVLLKFIRNQKREINQLESKIVKKFVWYFKRRVDERIEVEKSCMSIREIISSECDKLRDFVRGQNVEYIPLRWKWGHKKRPSSF